MVLRVGAMFAVIAMTAACMGGGKDGEDVPDLPEVPEPLDLNIGTTSSTQSATGLPFAKAIPSNFSYAGDYTVRVVGVLTDHESGETRIIISDEEFTIPEDPAFLEGTYPFNGQDVTLVYDPDRDRTYGLLPNGQEVTAYFAARSFYTNVVGLFSYSDTSDAGFDSEAMFVFGFETDPADMPTTAGIVTYEGNLLGYGNVVDAEGQLYAYNIGVNGNVYVDVGFADGNVSGDIYFSIVDDPVNPAETYFRERLAIDPTTLSGNGFGTTASGGFIECPSCSSNTQIGGAFFGPSAEEVGGLIAFDVTYDQGEEALTFMGPAGFVATPD